MFVICPVSFDLEDAEWHDDLYDAKEDAMNWSVELNGENVIVYEAVEGNYGYDFKPLTKVCA
jgi:hypothetical protein